jgi:hypothetical protein
VDREAAALRLSLGAEIRAELPRGRGPAVIRGYDGHDAAGRPVHAVRVATSLGVVMALGPLDAGDLDRTAPTELVPALEGVRFRSGTDLNGDGLVDVVVKNDAGTLSIWHVDAFGSAAYAIAMAAPPSRGIEIDGDPRLALAGALPVPPGDPIAPELGDVATFAAGGYTDATPAARAWHARLVPAPSPLLVVPLGPPRDDVRLRAAVERAWHAVLAGQGAEIVLRALGREPVPAPLRAAFDRHARAVADAASPR